jgi:putative peptidoglycan lipid II flippase
MVRNLFELLSTRQNSILSGAAILMVTVAASKVLGLVRDRLLAHNFSPDSVAVFLAAFGIPDMMFQLLIFGAVSVAFIPVFTEYIDKKGEKEAFEFASGILNLVLLVFILVGGVVLIFANQLTALAVPGFSFAEQQQTATLTRIIVFGQVLLAMGAFYAGISQAYQRFILPALAALFYNLGIILGIIFLTPLIGISGAAYGVVIGAAMHALIQLPLITKLGFRHNLVINLKDEGLLEVSKMMSMRTFGVAVEQINEKVGILLASLISTSSVTYLTFAQHLHTVPIGLFGATLAQAALPILSQERARGETHLFKATLLTTMHQILFLTLPAAAILIVLRIPAVRLVFGASQFDWPSTVLTGRTVAFLAAGLAAQAVALLLMRGFYALKDTRTPVLVSVVSVSLNVVLSYLFVRVMGWEVWSLGLSYAIVSNLSLVMLVTLLGNKLGGFSFKELWVPFLKMLFASLVAAVALYIPLKALDQLVFDTTKTINLLMLTGIAGLFGLGVYLVLVWLLQVKELQTFGGVIKRFTSMQSKLKSQEMVKETGTL